MTKVLKWSVSLFLAAMLFMTLSCRSLNNTTTIKNSTQPEARDNHNTIPSTSPGATSQVLNKLTFKPFRLAVTWKVKEDFPSQIIIITNTQSPLPKPFEYYTPSDPKKETIEDVDFSQYFLLIVCMGFQAVTGPSIEVKDTWQDQDKIHVQAEFNRGGPTFLPAYSSPGDIIKVSKDSLTQFGDITFILSDQWGDERAQTTCEIPH
jgi:hypothetical protein